MSQKEAPRVGLLKALVVGRVTGRDVAEGNGARVPQPDPEVEARGGEQASRLISSSITGPLSPALRLRAARGRLFLRRGAHENQVGSRR